MHKPGVIEITKNKGIKKYRRVKSKNIQNLYPIFRHKAQKKRDATNTPKGFYIAPKFRINSEQTPRKAFDLCCSDMKILIPLKKKLNQKKIIYVS